MGHLSDPKAVCSLMHPVYFSRLSSFRSASSKNSDHRTGCSTRTKQNNDVDDSAKALTTEMQLKRLLNVCKMDFTFEATLPFLTSQHATAVANALSADAELRPEHVVREISVEEQTLKARQFHRLLCTDLTSRSSFRHQRQDC